MDTVILNSKSVLALWKLLYTYMHHRTNFPPNNDHHEIATLKALCHQWALAHRRERKRGRGSHSVLRLILRGPLVDFWASVTGV